MRSTVLLWNCRQLSRSGTTVARAVRATSSCRGSTMADKDLLSVDYEIFGRVQGVFFRKYTQAEAKKLGLVGWVQNTRQGTVQGQLQGPSTSIRDIQLWLQTKGSPKSNISRAEFRNERKISSLEHSDFIIVK